MLPILFEFTIPFTNTKFPVYSYGLMIIVGFFCAYLLASHMSKDTPVKKGDLFDTGFVAVVTGFLGAKISYFLHNPDYFMTIARHPIENFSMLSGGLDFLGGFILAAPSVVIYLRKKKYCCFAVGDLVAPCIAVAHACGRIGCFLNGCCYGVRSDKLGLAFSDQSPVFHDQVKSSALTGSEFQSLPVFPTQLLEFALLILLTVYLYRKFSRRVFAGQNIALYFICYGIIRFITQFTRDDEYLPVGFLSLWHVVAIGILVAGLVLYIVLRKAGIRPFQYVREDEKNEISQTENSECTNTLQSEETEQAHDSDDSATTPSQTPKQEEETPGD